MSDIALTCLPEIVDSLGKASHASGRRIDLSFGDNNRLCLEGIHQEDGSLDRTANYLLTRVRVAGGRAATTCADGAAVVYASRYGLIGRPACPDATPAPSERVLNLSDTNLCIPKGSVLALFPSDISAHRRLLLADGLQDIVHARLHGVSSWSWHRRIGLLLPFVGKMVLLSFDLPDEDKDIPSPLRPRPEDSISLSFVQIS